jgi:transposase
MKTSTRFRPYEPDQMLLLPPDMREWLDKDDLVYFIMDVLHDLNLTSIFEDYDGEKGGQPPYDPQMMTALLLYAYCMGMPSSRRIEKATYDSVSFRVLTADQHPDHDTIAEFRGRHLKSMSSLFVEVLKLCRRMGLVKLGHVALDGTKVRANASKHKAMSYGRMEKAARELDEEVARLLAEAEAVDAEEDAKYGKGRRGDELPEELRYRESRLKKIRGAMRELEEEAKAKAEKKREEMRLKEEALAASRSKRGGNKPKEPGDKPDGKSQRNFTDPDSRIMKDGATGSFEQCYNAQIAVDAKKQIIVASDVTQDANDKQQVKPLVRKLEENTGGEKPKIVSADSGYLSEANIELLAGFGIDAYVATGKEKHNRPPPPAERGRIPNDATSCARMQRKLRTSKGRSTYSKRKQIVEPVFGQIKEARGLRRFLLRGLENVKAEWDLICLTHNLLKLFRSGRSLKTA